MLLFLALAGIGTGIAQNTKDYNHRFDPPWDSITHEVIGNRITEAYENTAGQDLVKTIMTDKISKGTPYLTTIHHRQTPCA